MVRILHIVTYMGRGGIETMLMNYFRRIDKTKIQFDFLVHRDFIADYDNEIESLGGKIYRFPVLNPFSKEYKSKLKKFFLSHCEYKIVHSHVDSMSSVPLKIAKECGVPVRIAHAHNCSEVKNLKYYLKLYYKSKLPQCANYFLACSNEAGKWLYGDREFILLNNAIDTKQYAFNMGSRVKIRDEFSISEDTLVIGNVSRFEPQKNHSFILDVFKNLTTSKPNCVLLLVGDGSLKNEIIEKSKLLKIDNKIIFAGIRRDVPHVLQAMDVFLFPSLFEGLPVSIIEAQTSGLPCLISDKVPIECKKTNIVDVCSLSNDTSIWVEKIMNLSRINRSDKSKEIATIGFDISSNARELEDFYLSLK